MLSNFTVTAMKPALEPRATSKGPASDSWETHTQITVNTAQHGKCQGRGTDKSTLWVQRSQAEGLSQMAYSPESG